MRMRNDVLEWYESIAHSYDELYSEEQKIKYLKVFKDLGQLENALIYDMGCGTGEVLLTLSSLGRVRYYVGIDLSPSLMELGKRKLRNVDIIHDFVGGDINRPPFRKNASNLVLCFTVVRCGDDVEEILTKLKSLVRTGGRVIMTVFCGRPIEKRDVRWCEGRIVKLSLREIACVVEADKDE